MKTRASALCGAMVGLVLLALGGPVGCGGGAGGERPAGDAPTASGPGDDVAAAGPGTPGDAAATSADTTTEAAATAGGRGEDTTTADTDPGPDAAAADAGPAGADAPDADPPPDAAAADTVAPAPVPVDPATLPPAAFVDVTAELGVDPDKSHRHCVAVADFDGNGRQDFVVVEGGWKKSAIHAVLLGPGAPGHVHTPLDTTMMSASFGCTAADLDGDDKPDLLFGGFGGPSVYLGDGKGGFADGTATWMPFVSDYAAFSIAPADLDGDGDLDLYVGAGFEPPACGGLKCAYTATDLACKFDPPPPVTPQMQDRVLIRGASPPLVDDTAAWGVPGGGNQTVTLALDVDLDGKMDVLVGDEADGHRLLHNAGGKFATHSTGIGFHPWAAAMGWAAGDLDGDGLVDLVLADAGPSPVYLQAPAKPGTPVQFVDGGGELGVWWPSWGASAWSPVVADFDHDGLEDLALGVSVSLSVEKMTQFIAGCGVSMGKDAPNPFAGMPSIDLLFLHGPGKALVASALPPGKYAHGLMIDQRFLDLDGDGDLDLVQTRPGPSMMPTARVRVLRNDLAKQGGSVEVIVTGKAGNRDALGTRITAGIGGVQRTRWLTGSAGFGGTASRFAHFGLGKAAVATGVTVHWPDGTQTVLGDVAVGETRSATWQ